MRKRRRILWTVVLVLTAIWAFLVIRVNLHYPSMEGFVYQEGEEAPLGYQENVTVRVNGSRFMTDEELIEYYPGDVRYTGLSNFKGIVASVTITNHGSEPAQGMPIFYFESGAFANANEMFSMTAMDGNDRIREQQPLILAPGESVTWSVPTTTYNGHFLPGEWEHVPERQFSLVYTLYPKRSIVLKLDEGVQK